jgi:hypothetical protein
VLVEPVISDIELAFMGAPVLVEFESFDALCPILTYSLDDTALGDFVADVTSTEL